ncbi:glycoside hydrolase family 113 [Antarcticibacterium sp. 1MA-6-2]|uniref:glycoside hydrolase family 113 n=1 Tax=Antarcticibacterium sp. 1MA-6-2 TaxID=2908210 RepID=UPI00288341BB|nr:glycoside hydrolase TIM-barrel-like domain-containing protein [Antarcticibacterium sp. 1MA-6-2]
MISKSESITSWAGKILLFLIYLFLTSCASKPPSEKINGVSFVASRNEVKPEDFQPVLKVNANAIAVMPFAFMQSLEHAEIRFNSERQWWGEREEGVKKTIRMAHQENLRVMLKPQIWLRGAFTGHLEMQTEADWNKLEEQYREFILFYAKLAEDENVDLFCIGTELNSFVQARPTFWSELIAEVREIYDGKLTYAENWDKIEEVHFWNKLDYIGADAYFPLSDEAAPTVEDLSRGWKPVKRSLKKLSAKVDRLGFVYRIRL